MSDHDLDAELADVDAWDTTDSSSGPVPGGDWPAGGPLAGFLDGMPLPKVAAVAAAGLVLGFIGGRVTAPESMVAVPMAAQVASPTTPAAPPRADTTERPAPYDAGTTYPAPPSAASPTTGDPSGLATGDPWKPKPGGTVTSDPLLAGYSTRIPPFYIKQRCLEEDETKNVPPEQCLRKWELLTPTQQNLWRDGIPI